MSSTNGPAEQPVTATGTQAVTGTGAVTGAAGRSAGGAGDGAGAREALEAGAVLPPGTTGAGERAVPLTARAYRHPGLDDRVVVRLVAGELGAAEDAAAAFLGMEPAGEPAVVGLGLRRSLGFPEWVLVHHPRDGHHALALVPELERAGRQVRTKPKATLDAYHGLAARLAGSVPHFLPTFFEQAARVFLSADNATYAAQMFTQARRAEAEHGLEVDEERLDAVFLEFALAGALPVKALTGYGRELAARVPADEALRRFRTLCARRTAGGLSPSAQMATELRRLARAAGRDADVEERSYLAEMLDLPATLAAPTGWWKAHRPALLALAADDPGVRGTLLNVMPRNGDDDMPAFWVELLEDSGATAGLGEGEVTARERPADGTAGWLRRFLRIWKPQRWRESRLPVLYALLERVADRLRAELTASGAAVEVKPDVDLIDLLLTLDVPVADPDEKLILLLEAWACGEGQRDLLALSTDPRFVPAFHRTADRFTPDAAGQRAVRRLAASPGGRPMLTAWMRTVARRSVAAGLPQLPDALRRLTWLPGEALILAEEEVAAAAGADLAAELARTLRAGLVDELGWPAWEEAVAALVGPDKVGDIEVADAWPHLVVAGPTQARVIGPEGTVLTHDLRPAPSNSYGDCGFHYVDGELLVYWIVYGGGHDLLGYWHSSAGAMLPLEAASSIWGARVDTVTLPLPGGGRALGGGVLHPGDTALPERRHVISDGVAYWVPADSNDDDGGGWREYDPAGSVYGRSSLPGFLADALRSAPAGSAFHSGWVLPVPGEEATPAGVPVGGLLGWRVIKLPDGSFRGEDLAGRTVTLRGGENGPGVPVRAVTFPGDDRPRALTSGYRKIELVDPEGVVTAEVAMEGGPGAFAEGTALLPPLRYWRCMRPRDPEGSLALRRIDHETAASLLKAAASVEATRSAQPGQPVRAAQTAREELRALVRALLPRVTDDALIAGIAGVARYAAAQQATLDAVAARLADAVSGGGADQAPDGPDDKLTLRALNGLGVSGPSWWYDQPSHGAFAQIRAIRRMMEAVSDPAAPAAGSAATAGAGPAGASGTAGPAVPIHLDGPELPYSRVRWEQLLTRPASVAYRAASATTAPQEADVLEELLRRIEELGMASADPAHWRRFTLHLDQVWLHDAAGRPRGGSQHALLPLGDGAFAAFTDAESENGGSVFTTFLHDPAGRFRIPHPYTERSSGPVGEAREAGWLAEFLAARAERGPAPWRPEAAEEFARLTGVTSTVARLVVAGLPYVDSHDRAFLPSEVRVALGLKVAEAAVARDELRELDGDARREVVAALLPANPAALWTDGPDVAAAARVWNARMGRRTAVPEWLLAEAARVTRVRWRSGDAVRALLDPASAPELTHDLRWHVHRDRVVPVDAQATGFTADTLTGAVALCAWLAHRLPAGDPFRAALPAALTAVRARLANPDLMLDLGSYIDLPAFRKVAGAPTEVTDGWERYGAVIMATHDSRPAPGVRTALLDASGADPYLPALRALLGRADGPLPVEVALRLARDPRFEALLADPGDPGAGERAADGTWWPQDPARSVPDLVAQVAREHGLGQDAAVLYLTLLAMPDPTDKNVTRWTGWKPARFKAARAELAATALVVEATRTRAGRSLFLPGGWLDPRSPHVPLEQWKTPLFESLAEGSAPLGVVAPTEPAAVLYARAWQRVRDGDVPRLEELRVRRGRRR